MLVASVGAGDGRSTWAWRRASGRATRGRDRLTFGGLEPLVALMQETPVDRLLPAVVERIKGGTDLRELVAAAAPGQRPHLRRRGLRRASTR